MTRRLNSSIRTPRPILFGEVNLVPVAEIEPAAYNPRKVVPERLELVRLSIAKLGWLLPIYATAEGRILSGHQRHFVATEMLGATEVPVVRVGNLNHQVERSLNLVFNRMTNDMKIGETSDALAEALTGSDILERLAKLRDLDMRKPEAFPVLQAELVDVGEVLDANPLWTDEASVGLAGFMRNVRVGVMPIVCTPDREIINGKARAAAAARGGIREIPVVTIPKAKARTAGDLLNLLSMKYDMQGGLADDFRANAFKAAPSTREGLSVNSCYDLIRAKNGKVRPSQSHFGFDKPEHRKAWLRYYGNAVLDWGAGNYVDAANFERMGARVCAFEPYHQFDRDKAREAAARWFFDRMVGGGPEFTTIFLSNVINSVPFEEDRRVIVTLIASLAGPGTLLAASTRSTDELWDVLQYKNYAGAMQLRRVSSDHERNSQVSNLNGRPLIQKFHTQEEFAELWRHGFRKVNIPVREGNWSLVRATDPIRPSVAEVRKAIEFEFDLPFDDGRRLNLVDEALAVWRARGWDL